MIKISLLIIFCIIVVASIVSGIKDHLDNKKYNRNVKTIYEDGVKRALDFFIATMVLVIFSPIYIILYILVEICLGRPALFIQKRPGRDEKSFNLYKFRTMTEKKDEAGQLLPDNDRLTKFGGFLRSTSLDELPEILNIIKGDMSIIGPRPLLVSYLPYYTDEERKRHSVRMGLTQPEVLYGLVNPTWDEQLKYEAEYAENVSFITDVRIATCTIIVLFKRVKSDYGDNIRVALSEERSKEKK